MDVYDVLSAAANGCIDKGAALATIVSVEGHAYRKQGAMMLLSEGGEAVGSISPGCLEADLLARVPEVVQSGKYQLVRYDTTSEDDPLWGTSVGCGGVIQVLVEPLAGALQRCLLHIHRKLKFGECVCLVREIVGEGEHGSISYKMQPVPAEGIPTSAAGIIGAAQIAILFAPKPRLVVFGANHDSRPLVQLALHSGFRVTAADWREALCTSDRFPGAELTAAYPCELIKRLELTERDFVVVMSHHMERDREFIEYLVPHKLKYVGIMGSTVRISRLLEGIKPPSWFRYPVGLRIGAVGPEEIAVSIVAEMIAVRQGRHDALNGVEAHDNEIGRHLSRCRSGNADGLSEAFR